MNTLAKGGKAPNIELPLLEGGTFSLREALQSGPVILAFFKISCPVCQYSFPLYDRLAKRLAKQGVQVIGVSQDNAKDTQRFVIDYGVKFPIALEETSKFAVSNAYGLTNVPTLFAIAQDGTIEMSSVGWAKDDVEAVLQRYDSAPVPLFQTDETIASFRAG